MAKVLDYRPLELVDTSSLSRDEWLAYRRKGIGGSDAAAVLGISPFRTARDLYFDKLGFSIEADEENWVALEMGRLLEPLVAEVFARKTELRVYQRKVMLQHPQYPWMLADLDYLVDLPDGGTAILECKTTASHARENWWYNDKEIVPVYYESQGRHYMSVMNISRVYFCCLCMDSRDAVIRCIDRDMAYEEELIALEQAFWREHVLAKTPPPYTEDGDLILKSLQRLYGPSNKDAPPVVITPPQFTKVQQFLQLQEKKCSYDAESKKLGTEMERLKALIVADMGKSCKAVYEDAGNSYTITFNPTYRKTISKEGLERLKAVHPDIYTEYVTTSESRRFSIKKAATAV